MLMTISGSEVFAFTRGKKKKEKKKSCCLPDFLEYLSWSAVSGSFAKQFLGKRKRGHIF